MSNESQDQHQVFQKPLFPQSITEAEKRFKESSGLRANPEPGEQATREGQNPLHLAIRAVVGLWRGRVHQFDIERQARDLGEAIEHLAKLLSEKANENQPTPPVSEKPAAPSLPGQEGEWRVEEETDPTETEPHWNIYCGDEYITSCGSKICLELAARAHNASLREKKASVEPEALSATTHEGQMAFADALREALPLLEIVRDYEPGQPDGACAPNRARVLCEHITELLSRTSGEQGAPLISEKEEAKEELIAALREWKERADVRLERITELEAENARLLEKKLSERLAVGKEAVDVARLLAELLQILYGYQVGLNDLLPTILDVLNWGGKPEASEPNTHVEKAHAQLQALRDYLAVVPADHAENARTNAIGELDAIIRLLSSQATDSDSGSGKPKLYSSVSSHAPKSEGGGRTKDLEEPEA